MIFKALPKNPNLWALHRLLDSANRWLDHCDDWDDHEAIKLFIAELEVKIDEMTQAADYLTACFKKPEEEAEQQ